MARLMFVSHTARLEAGSTQSLLKLLKYLRAEHDLAVVVSGTGELPEVLRAESIVCYHLRSRVRYYLPALIFLIIRGKFDLVYGNNFSSRPRYALWAARLTRRPFVWHIRELVEHVRLANHLPYADEIIANSQPAARAAKRFLTEDKDVTVILNGIDLEEFNVDRNTARRYLDNTLNIRDQSLVVINVGRVCAQKNQLQAVEVTAHVIQEDPSVFLCLVGRVQEADYAAQIMQRAAQLGIQDNVRLLGFQSNIGQYLCGSDILLHTSSRESQGRVLIEAMAARLPVIAFDVGGVSESVVPESTGYLVPFGDVATAARSLRELVENPSLRQQMGERGRQRVERLFTAERTAQQVNAVIERVLQR